MFCSCVVCFFSWTRLPDCLIPMLIFYKYWPKIIRPCNSTKCITGNCMKNCRPIQVEDNWVLESRPPYSISHSPNLALECKAPSVISASQKFAASVLLFLFFLSCLFVHNPFLLNWSSFKVWYIFSHIVAATPCWPSTIFILVGALLWNSWKQWTRVT